MPMTTADVITVTCEKLGRPAIRDREYAEAIVLYLEQPVVAVECRQSTLHDLQRELARTQHFSHRVLVATQLTALFTSAPILASSAAVSSFSAKAVGHMWPSSRFALSLKPSVAYLVLNFCALWKKQTTLPSLAYAGIPYQVFGERAGALALMIPCSRSPMARSGSGISAIFASTSLSPSAVFLFARASAFNSLARSFIAACSSSVNPWDVLPTALG